GSAGPRASGEGSGRGGRAADPGGGHGRPLRRGDSNPLSGRPVSARGGVFRGTRRLRDGTTVGREGLAGGSGGTVRCLCSGNGRSVPATAVARLRGAAGLPRPQPRVRRVPSGVRPPQESDSAPAASQPAVADAP